MLSTTHRKFGNSSFPQIKMKQNRASTHGLRAYGFFLPCSLSERPTYWHFFNSLYERKEAKVRRSGKNISVPFRPGLRRAGVLQGCCRDACSALGHGTLVLCTITHQHKDLQHLTDTELQLQPNQHGPSAPGAHPPPAHQQHSSDCSNSKV